MKLDKENNTMKKYLTLDICGRAIKYALVQED